MDKLLDKKNIRFAVFGSGRGSNFSVLVEKFKLRELYAQPVLVISDNSNAKILDLAHQYDIPCYHIDMGIGYKLCGLAEEKCIQILKKYCVDFIVLAGFLRIIQQQLLELFANKILNIHPSLLPSFPGLEAWKQALKARVKETGCTVHIVDSGIDTGQILGQMSVPIFETDTPEILLHRIQMAEYELYPKIINEFIKIID